jgi:hypothetical protein
MKEGRLLVADLINYFYDEVVLYVCHDDDFEDIYKGKVDDIPCEMRNYKVTLIGAKRKGVLDVNVKTN